MDPGPSSSWFTELPEHLRGPPRLCQAELAGELRKVELSLELADRYCVEHHTIMREVKEHVTFTEWCMKVFNRMYHKSTEKMDKAKQKVAMTRERVSELEKRFLMMNSQEAIGKVSRDHLEVELLEARGQLREEMNQLCEELKVTGEFYVAFSKFVFADTSDVREAVAILSIVERNREQLLAQRKKILASLRALRNEKNVDR